MHSSAEPGVLQPVAALAPQGEVGRVVRPSLAQRHDVVNLSPHAGGPPPPAVVPCAPPAAVHAPSAAPRYGLLPRLLVLGARVVAAPRLALGPGLVSPGRLALGPRPALASLARRHDAPAVRAVAPCPRHPMPLAILSMSRLDFSRAHSAMNMHPAHALASHSLP